MGPSRLFGATCEQMQKFRDGPGGLGDPGGPARRTSGIIRDFRAENRPGTLRRPAPIIWYHPQPEQNELQPCSLPIFMKTTQKLLILFF